MDAAVRARAGRSPRDARDGHDVPRRLRPAARSLRAQPAAVGQAVPQAAPGTAPTPRAGYDRRRDLPARRPPVDPAPAAALTRADIRVRADGASARATMPVDGEVFRLGVAKVMLIKG